MSASQAVFSWHTKNTKLASALGYLQFPIRTQVNQDVRSGKVETMFFMGDTSVDVNPPYVRDFILQNWDAGTLAQAEPLHPFLQGMRAEHNFEMLMDAQKKGRRIRLVGVAGSHATEYRDGQELPELVNAAMVFRLADASLVAALGTLGIPVIKIEYDGKRHIYTLPVEGHALRQRDGSVQRYNGVTLAQRQDDCRDLLLELRDPRHPIVSAYGTRQVHQQLLKHLESEVEILCIRPEGTQRKAFVTINATGAVMDKVTDHFRV